jgi:ATP-dependent exoDNAse (exonuclease V) alpha subunit
VRSVERGIINLEDGRRVPANYRQFAHGYAVTAHRGQGKTVDQVIISADSMKQELFYVAASRGREGISIVTSNVERLRESLGVSMARPSAIELANEISRSEQPPERSAEINPKQGIEVLKPTRDIEQHMGLGL